MLNSTYNTIDLYPLSTVARKKEQKKTWAGFRPAPFTQVDCHSFIS